MAALRRDPRHVAIVVALTATALVWVAPLLGLVLWLLLVLWALAAAPGATLALSWAGFWLYLGSLDLLGIETRSRYTAIWYVLVAAILVGFAWTRRHLIGRRLRASSGTQRLWIAAAVLLGLDFAFGAAVLGGTSLAHKLLALFLVSTIPVTVAAVGLGRRDLEHARLGLVVLGVGFAVVDLIAARHGGSDVSRFSPIASLDPISASLVTSLGCAAAMTLRPRSRPGLAAVAVLCFLLAGAAQLNGSRGPLLALGAAMLAVLVTRRRTAIAVVAASIAGVAVGTTVEPALFNQPSAVGSLVNAPQQQAGPKSPSEAPISSIHIRKEWIRSALRQVPRRPLAGHGIGVLVDDTPEAARMGVKGQLIYPHNDAVEAAYSLGAIGLVLFALFTLVPLAVLWRHRRRLVDIGPNFVFVIFAFAFVESNFSGEIGTDALLWSSSCLVVLTLRNTPPALEEP